jgi:preprotein translocase subunit SecE
VKKKELKVADKNEKAKEPNALQRYFRETIGELRKVNWPTTKEALNLTKIVLLVLLAMSLVLGLLDFSFSKIIAAIIS